MNLNNELGNIAKSGAKVAFLNYNSNADFTYCYYDTLRRKRGGLDN